MKPISVQVFDPHRDSLVEFKLPLWMLWLLYSSVYHLARIGGDIVLPEAGIQRVAAIAGIGALIFPDPPVEVDAETLRSFETILNQMIDQIEQQVQPVEQGDQVLVFTYALLQQKKLTYAEAATFATIALNLPEPIRPHAWLMRLSRWIDKHKLPRVGQRRPRTRKKINHENK